VSTPARPDPKSGRPDRQAQLLEAAGRCFSREGFHGASMASIAAEASMSVGQIYRHFASKEAVIEALVARHLADWARRMAEVRARFDDPVEQMLEVARYQTSKVSGLTDAALSLEFLAEAARNPRIARIVRTVDTAMRDHLKQIMLSTGCADDALLTSRIDMIVTLIDGWPTRLMKTPELRLDDYLAGLRLMFEKLLSRDCSG